MPLLVSHAFDSLDDVRPIDPIIAAHPRGVLAQQHRLMLGPFKNTDFVQLGHGRTLRLAGPKMQVSRWPRHLSRRHGCASAANPGSGTTDQPHTPGDPALRRIARITRP